MSDDGITYVYVCRSCRLEGFAGEEDNRPGTIFGRNLVARAGARGLAGRVRVKGVNCLSVCKRPCTVAVAGADKFAYVIGNLDAACDMDAVLDFALLYAEASDGITLWRERPEVVRKNTVARVPPFAHAHDPVVEIDTDAGDPGRS